MLIISVGDMEIIAKRETKKKNRKGHGDRRAIEKGWELNDFVVHLS